MPDDYLVEITQDGSVRHTYRYIGGPIEQPDQYQELMQAIGHEAASWARMEQHLDAILVQINKIHHSNEVFDLYNPDHPRPLSDKLRLLKRYFNRHPGLSRYKDTIRDFSGAVKKLAVERNELMHGVLEDYDHAKKIVTLNGMTYRKKTNDFHNVTQSFELAKLHDVARLTNLAHYMLCDVSKELFTADGVKRLQMPPPQTRRS